MRLYKLMKAFFMAVGISLLTGTMNIVAAEEIEPA